MKEGEKDKIVLIIITISSENATFNVYKYLRVSCLSIKARKNSHGIGGGHGDTNNDLAFSFSVSIKRATSFMHFAW